MERILFDTKTFDIKGYERWNKINIQSSKNPYIFTADTWMNELMGQIYQLSALFYKLEGYIFTKIKINSDCKKYFEKIDDVVFYEENAGKIGNFEITVDDNIDAVEITNDAESHYAKIDIVNKTC